MAYNNRGNDPSLGGSQQDYISAKLAGANGFGSDSFSDDDGEGVQRALTDLHARISRGGMSRGDAALVLGVSRHINARSFMETARRRAAAWRMISALANRVVEFEGLARIHFESAEFAGQLALQLPYTVADKEVRLMPLAEFAREHDLTAAQRVIEQARDYLVEVADDTLHRYWEDVGKRMAGGRRE